MEKKKNWKHIPNPSRNSQVCKKWGYKVKKLFLLKIYNSFGGRVVKYGSCVFSI